MRHQQHRHQQHEKLERQRNAPAARAKGVQIGALSYALSKVPTTASCIGGASLPVAEDIAERGVALPLFPQMTEDECATVVEVVSGLLAG